MNGMERSTLKSTAPGTSCQNEGQPVPESNLVLDSKTGVPHPAQLGGGRWVVGWRKAAEA
jgi:hypothetical protein